MSNNLISLKNITKKYGASDNITLALNNIELEISKGEMIAVMGPSGSGKSTLLNILGCIDVPTEGEYYMGGKKISFNSGNELSKIRNSKIGFVFQNFSLLNEYTVFDNIELPLIYRNKLLKNKLLSKQRKECVLNLINKLGIIKHKDKYPGQLSGGQQQRAAIARALVNEPEIILADEPTGALDQKTGKEIMELLREINNQGKTIIIVTHDKNVANYCKRLIEICDGNIVTDNEITV